MLYHATAGEAWIQVEGATNAPRKLPGDGLDAEQSRSLFERRGTITRIDVGIPAGVLWPLKTSRQAARQEKQKAAGLVSAAARTRAPRA